MPGEAEIETEFYLGSQAPPSSAAFYAARDFGYSGFRANAALEAPPPPQIVVRSDDTAKLMLIGIFGIALLVILTDNQRRR